MLSYPKQKVLRGYSAFVSQDKMLRTCVPAQVQPASAVRVLSLCPAFLPSTKVVADFFDNMGEASGGSESTGFARRCYAAQPFGKTAHLPVPRAPIGRSFTFFGLMSMVVGHPTVTENRQQGKKASFPHGRPFGRGTLRSPL